MNCKKELLPFDHISYYSCDSAAILSIFYVRCNNVFQDGFVKTKCYSSKYAPAQFYVNKYMFILSFSKLIYCGEFIQGRQKSWK